MNRRMGLLYLVLTTFAPLGLALPAVAQEPPKDRVPFKTTIKGDFHTFMVPGTPTILSIRETGTGEATPLGAFTWVAHLIDHLDLATGQDWFAEAVGAFTATNGDALYVKYSLIRRPSPDPGLVLFEGTWMVTGGKGRFTGATGSGVNRFEVIPASRTNPNGKVTVQWDGSISAPKP